MPDDPSFVAPRPSRVSDDANGAKIEAEIDGAFRCIVEKNRRILIARRAEPAPARLTPERMAQLEARIRQLIVRLKWNVRRQDLLKLGDTGNVGVPHAVFTAGWDGVTLNAPSL